MLLAPVPFITFTTAWVGVGNAGREEMGHFCEAKLLVSFWALSRVSVSCNWLLLAAAAWKPAAHCSSQSSW